MKKFQIRKDEELTNFEQCRKWWNNGEIENQMKTVDEKDQDLSQPDLWSPIHLQTIHKIKENVVIILVFVLVV